MQKINKKTVLYVEDEKGIQELIQQFFQHCFPDQNLTITNNGQEALNYLKTNDFPDAILCDVKMPIMNGIVFKKIINNVNCLKLNSIPFLFTTGTAYKIEEAFPNNGFDILAKPFGLDQFKNYMNPILSKETVCDSKPTVQCCGDPENHKKVILALS